jgi:beta-glucosidase-like glycosyl hydrolase
LQTILRGQLAFEGIILADDLGMGAIARAVSENLVYQALQFGSFVGGILEY